MKLFPLMMFMLALQVAIVIFDNPTYVLEGSGDTIPLLGSAHYNQSINANGTQSINYTDPADGSVKFFNVDPSSVWNAISRPFGGGQTIFYAFLAAFATYVFAIGLFASRNEMVYLSPIFFLFIGFGFIPCYNLWHVISRDVSPIICGAIEANQICGPGGFIALLVAGPLYLLWFISCLEYWTARSMA